MNTTLTQTHTRIHLHQTMFTSMDTHTHHGVNSDCESVASVFQCPSSLNQCLPSIQSLVWIYWIWIHQSEAACLLFRTKTTVASSFRRWDDWKTCPDRDFQLWFEWNLYRFPLTPTSINIFWIKTYNLCWTSENWASKKNLFGHEEQIQRELCTLAYLQRKHSKSCVL